MTSSFCSPRIRAACCALSLVLSTAALAQSKDDRKASLTGVTVVGILESGVGGLGGGTAGSPFVLQAELAFKKAGIVVVGLDKANSTGLPIYNIHCTSMESGDQVRLACESRLLRHLFLNASEDSKGVYAIVWTSPLIIASVPNDALADVEKLTATCIDALIKDWREANPAAPAKKKQRRSARWRRRRCGGRLRRAFSRPTLRRGLSSADPSGAEGQRADVPG